MEKKVEHETKDDKPHVRTYVHGLITYPYIQ